MLSAGAADVPLHAPLTSPQAAYQLHHSGARGVFVSGQAHLDRVLDALGELPDLEWIVTFDKTTPREGAPPVYTWAGLLQRGQQELAKLEPEIHAREAATTSADLATIIYTSGTTGRPKGVMLSHGNLLSNATSTAHMGNSKSSDILLSWLPYSHIYARTCDHYVTIFSGATVCLADSVDTLLLNIAETQPTDLTSVPRFYEKVWSAVEPLPPEVRTAHLKAMFGTRMRRFSSGGAPLPKHVGKGFEQSGLILLEGYGLTESSPVISFNSFDACKMGTVGKALDHVEIKIADDGEILTRGPHVMQGYWKDPEATHAVLVDGWLHTGDVGTIDEDGYLSITDRKKDLIITSGGKNIAPSELERLLTSDPFIDQAVVYGDGRPFVSALIVPNLGLLAEKARELGTTLDAENDLIQSQAIRQFLGDRVAKLMEQVSKPERVKEILILGRALQASDDELTATHKVRRRHVISKFENALKALYEKSDTAKFNACSE